jgi:hypothetical protein
MDMVTIAAALLSFRYGIAASTSRTVPVMSVEFLLPARLVQPDRPRADIGNDNFDAAELGGHIFAPGIERWTIGHVNRTAEKR